MAVISLPRSEQYQVWILVAEQIIAVDRSTFSTLVGGAPVVTQESKLANNPRLHTTARTAVTYYVDGSIYINTIAKTKPPTILSLQQVA